MMLLTLLSLIAVVNSQDQSVCGKLERAYESICPNQMAGNRAPFLSQVLSGKRGPAGPKGDRGLPGSKGDAAEPNYLRLEEMITRKMQEVFDEQRRNITELSNALLEANGKIGILQNQTVYCPMQYDGKCFWIEFHGTSAITFEQARAICKAKGATPANIYSEEHYFIIMGYVRPFGGRSDVFMNVWLGMKYSFERSVTYHYNGATEAQFTKWHPGFPLQNRCCNIVLQTHVQWDSAHQHMYTEKPSSRSRGVLCEITLP